MNTLPTVEDTSPFRNDDGTSSPSDGADNDEEGKLKATQTQSGYFA